MPFAEEYIAVILICLAQLRLLVTGTSSYVWQVRWHGSLSEPIPESAFSKNKFKPPAVQSRRLKKQQNCSQIWYRQFLVGPGKMYLCFFLTHKLCVVLCPPERQSQVRYALSVFLNSLVLMLQVYACRRPTLQRLQITCGGGWGGVRLFHPKRLTRCAYHIKLDVLVLVRDMPWIGKSAVGGPLFFQARSINWEKRMLDFKCLSVRPPVRMEELGSQCLIFLRIVIFERFSKMCHENSSFITVWWE